MKTTATLIATLMLGVASCAYAQGGPADGLGGGAGGPVGIGGGAPGGGGPAGGPDAGGSPVAEGPGPASKGPGGGDGPSAERAAPRSEASEGPSSGERGGRQKSAEESSQGRGSKGGDTSKASRSERRADDGDAKGTGDKQPKKADSDGDKSRQRAADKAESKDIAKEAKDAGKQKKDDVTDKASTPAPKDADTARAEKPERVKQVDLSGDKRDRVQGALRDKGDVKHRTDVDIDISVGRRLPRDWDFVPVPLVVVEIVPEYRDYVFVWVEDEYVICDPVTYEVVAVIPASGSDHARAGSAGSGGKCSARLTLSEDQEVLILKSVRLGREVDVADLEVGWSVPGDIELEEFPTAVLSEADELSACRYFIADDQLAIVDPDEDKVVLLIDKI